MAQVLIHIGFPKAGSTYLQHWFAKHPAMFYQLNAVAGFYHSTDLSKYAESPESLHGYFVLSAEHLSAWQGEPDIVGLKNTKLYDVEAYQKKIVATLHGLYPHAKILIVTRGYTSFFQSFYAEYLSVGGVLDFAVLLKNFGPFFNSVLNYTGTITNYRNVFGEENVIVLPYEMLRQNPVAFTSFIEERLGVKEKFAFASEKINPSLNSNQLFTYKRFSNFLFRIIQPLPYSLQRIVFGYYTTKLRVKKPNAFIQFLSKFNNGAVELPGLEQTLEGLKGQAEILRHEKLYEPYLKEYLL